MSGLMRTYANAQVNASIVILGADDMYKVASSNNQRRGKRAVLSFSYPDAASAAEEDGNRGDPLEAGQMARTQQTDLNQTRQEFRTFLCELRGRVGDTRAQFAQRLGVSVNLIARWENGTSKVNADSVALIKRRLAFLQK